MTETNLNGQTLDIVAENVKKLKQLFPEIVTEDKIDFARLQDVLGNYIERNDESYKFSWYGKSDAFRKSQVPSTGTLRPCPEDGESKNWDTTQNLYIEGDNLEVLKLLGKSYAGQVKMIYIDPPYNKDKDFVYPDKWSDPIKEYKRITGQLDEDGNTTTSEEETEGGRHTRWLNMMYPRLRLASNLLTDDGVIFISIDDDEVANLRRLCNDVFGEENFITTIHVELSATQGMKVKAAKDGNIVKNAEYILVYGKNTNKTIGKTLLYDYRPDYDTHYSKMLKDDMTIVNLKDEFSIKYPDIKTENLTTMYAKCPEFENYVKENITRIFADDKITGFDINDFEVGKVYKVERDSRKYYIINNGTKMRQLMFLSDSFGQCDDFNNSYGLRKIRGDWWKDFYKDMGNVSKEGNVVYSNGKKPVRLIKQLAKLVTKKNDIVFDFFAGSATTAHSVMQLNSEDGGNRKFIMVQFPENLDLLLETAETTAKKDIKSTIEFLDSIEKTHFISEIGKYRIRNSGESIKAELKEKYDTYMQKQQSLISSEEPAPMNPDDLDIGFKVFKLDTSNLKRWSVDVGEDFYTLSKEEQNAILAERLGFEVNNFVEGRNELDMVYEIMLKYGLDLSYPVDTYTFNDKNVYSIGMGALLICLNDNLNKELATDIVGLVNELEPTSVRVVVKDLSFINDSEKTNFKEDLKTGVNLYFAKENDKANKENQFEFITI